MNVLQSYPFIKTGYVSYVKIDHYTLMNMTASSAVTNSFMQFMKANRISAWSLGSLIVFPFCTSMTFTAKSHKCLSTAAFE